MLGMEEKGVPEGRTELPGQRLGVVPPTRGSPQVGPPPAVAHYLLFLSFLLPLFLPENL